MYQIYYDTMYLLKSSNSVRSLTFVFVSILLASLGISTGEVFAMLDSPGTCPNRYDGPITSFVINNGSQTLDAIANPGMTFNENTFGTYNIKFVIHTQNTSSQGNSDPGTTWYVNSEPGYWGGHCIPANKVTSIGPNQDVTISYDIFNRHKGGEYVQSVSFDTFAGNTVTYNVHWITAPTSPQNLVATTVSPLQINLSWTDPANDGGSAITGYEIERSTDNGTTWSTIVANTSSTSTAYSDTSVIPTVTYTYRVSAINEVGTGNPSNNSSASTLQVGLVAPPSFP